MQTLNNYVPIVQQPMHDSGTFQIDTYKKPSVDFNGPSTAP